MRNPNEPLLFFNNTINLVPMRMHGTDNDGFVHLQWADSYGNAIEVLYDTVLGKMIQVNFSNRLQELKSRKR